MSSTVGNENSATMRRLSPNSSQISRISLRGTVSMVTTPCRSPFHTTGSWVISGETAGQTADQRRTFRRPAEGAFAVIERDPDVAVAVEGGDEAVEIGFRLAR